MPTEDQVANMLANPENEFVEIKQDWSTDGDKIRKAICAFANDLPNRGEPAFIIVGARDNRTPFPHTTKDLERIQENFANARRDGNIVPPPSLDVQTVTVAGHTYVVASVHPSDSPPVRYEGRIWVRVGASTQQATAQDERRLAEKRRTLDRSFDTIAIPQTTLASLNLQQFNDEYLPRAVAREVLEQNGRTVEQRLASLGFVASADEPTPTVAGLLTLANSPREWIPCAYVQFRRIDGDELTDPTLDEKEIDGPISELLRRLEDLVKSNVRSSVFFAHDSKDETRRPDYSVTALIQLVHNAILHRTYERTNAPVRLTWFSHRIELYSPGGPFGMVTKSNFGQTTDYRNPKLAEIMKTLGFVQRFGAGIATARKHMADNGNPPPEFAIEDNSVTVIVKDNHVR